MRIAAVTLFPDMFAALTEHGITGRAVKQGALSFSSVNPRDFTLDRHRTVDDKAYGGGPGMVMSVEPLQKAIASAKQVVGDDKAKVVYLSPQGKPFAQSTAARLSGCPSLVLLCGRYEGIDERLIEAEVDEEISLGDYVISGGELAAMVVLDAVIRLLPGVLGNEQSGEQDSFSGLGLLDYPHYTRPEEIAGKKVPEVLLSGDHQKIAAWRFEQALLRTWLRRPELIDQANLNEDQLAVLARITAGMSRINNTDN